MGNEKWFYCCYKDGELEKNIGWGASLFIIVLFPFLWIAFVINSISMFFKSSFYVTEEEFYKRKLKEVRDNKKR